MPNPPLASFLGFLLGFLSIFGGIPGEVWCGAIGIPIPTGCGTNRGGRRIEYRKMAAKKRKKRRSSCVFAPFAPFCGYSFGPACGLCYGLLRKLLGRRTRKCKMRLISTLAFPRQTWIRCPRNVTPTRPHFRRHASRVPGGRSRHGRFPGPSARRGRGGHAHARSPGRNAISSSVSPMALKAPSPASNSTF